MSVLTVKKKQKQGKGKTTVTWLKKTGRATEEDDSQPGFKNEVISLQLIKINEKKKEECIRLLHALGRSEGGKCWEGEHRALSIHPGDLKLQSHCASKVSSPGSSFMSSFHTLQHPTNSK